ncbi:MAG TPA: hypothetical protein VFZ61_05560 [Polyangiales bacterium]
MSRIFLYLASLFVCSVALAQAEPAASDRPEQREERPAQRDGSVFMVRDREGRQVYTNLDGLASHGKARRELTLPPLSSVDFAHSLPGELRALDQHVSECHDALQSGSLCDAIRKSSRTPTWSRLWTDHGRKLIVAAALLVVAAILGLVGSGRRLGTLFPLVPLLGCAFLGYATYRDLHASRDALTAGLRACSEELPEGSPESPKAVEGRLSRALEVQGVVNRAFVRQEEQIEAAMREAR